MLIVPDPDSIRSVDLDPGGQKLRTKIEKKLRNFKVLDVLY
jgi:hypothetical protein